MTPSTVTLHDPPERPKIYHITHVGNLPRIFDAGHLRSDRRVRDEDEQVASIGLSTIKERRLRLPVTCHPGDYVGDYVPFYFGPRSVMLYVIYKADHPELTYRGGQGPIVHLEADLREVVEWAEQNDRRWAFSLSNAGAYYTEFRRSMQNLNEVKWSSVAATDWRASDVREEKQAEFLVHDHFPVTLVSRIGVHSRQVQEQVQRILLKHAHRPPVTIEPRWYY